MKVKKYIVRIFLWLPCAVFGTVRNNLNGEKGGFWWYFKGFYLS